MTKKNICFVLIIFMVLTLSGCCLSHEWEDATCMTPRTCRKCSQTEGVALGHTVGEWIENPNNANEQILLCTQCHVTTDSREYQVESADGYTWKLGNVPYKIYNNNGFVISCNDFMGVYARALTLMPDYDEHTTQLNYLYDHYGNIKIIRDQNVDSHIAISFEGNEKLHEPMKCVSLRVPVDQIVNNYTSYRPILLNILGAFPLAIDRSLETIENGTELIVELINSAADNDISRGTVTLIDNMIPTSIEWNNIIYTLFVQEDYLYIIASVGTIEPISQSDFRVRGDCAAGGNDDMIRSLTNKRADMFWNYYDPLTDRSQAGVITTARDIELGCNIFNVLSKYQFGEYGNFTTDCAFYKRVPYAIKHIVINDCHTYLTYFYGRYGIHFFFNKDNELTFVAFSNGVDATA